MATKPRTGTATNKAGIIPLRNVRVPDERWDRAKAAATRRGETVSAAINRFLEEYAAEDQP